MERDRRGRSEEERRRTREQRERGRPPGGDVGEVCRMKGDEAGRGEDEGLSSCSSLSTADEEEEAEEEVVVAAVSAAEEDESARAD